MSSNCPTRMKFASVSPFAARIFAFGTLNVSARPEIVSPDLTAYTNGYFSGVPLPTGAYVGYELSARVGVAVGVPVVVGVAVGAAVGVGGAVGVTVGAGEGMSVADGVNAGNGVRGVVARVAASVPATVNSLTMLPNTREFASSKTMMRLTMRARDMARLYKGQGAGSKSAHGNFARYFLLCPVLCYTVAARRFSASAARRRTSLQTMQLVSTDGDVSIAVRSPLLILGAFVSGVLVCLGATLYA